MRSLASITGESIARSDGIEKRDMVSAAWGTSVRMTGVHAQQYLSKLSSLAMASAYLTFPTSLPVRIGDARSRRSARPDAARCPSGYESSACGTGVSARGGATDSGASPGTVPATGLPDAVDFLSTCVRRA